MRTRWRWWGGVGSTNARFPSPPWQFLSVRKERVGRGQIKVAFSDGSGKWDNCGGPKVRLALTLSHMRGAHESFSRTCVVSWSNTCSVLLARAYNQRLLAWPQQPKPSSGLVVLPQGCRPGGWRAWNGRGGGGLVRARVVA
jgi:hypothetical protein